MTLFFNLEKLIAEAAGDSIKFLKLLNSRTLRGNSFILNPKPLFNLPNLDTNYLVQYVKLAGRRDYFLYKTLDIITLDTSYFPELNISAIKTNPLLTINNRLINFKYEEIYNGTKFYKHQRQSSKEVS